MENRAEAREAWLARDAAERARIAFALRLVIGVGPAPNLGFVEVPVEPAVLLDEAVVVAEERPGNPRLDKPAERCPPLAVVNEDQRRLPPPHDLVGKLEGAKPLGPVDDHDVARPGQLRQQHPGVAEEARDVRQAPEPLQGGLGVGVTGVGLDADDRGIGEGAAEQVRALAQ
ncbi:MAG: hypothetical protein ACYTES_21145, partial [Planctomycetota bacterium]